jgi:hypothetical protein
MVLDLGILTAGSSQSSPCAEASNLASLAHGPPRCCLPITLSMVTLLAHMSLGISCPAHDCPYVARSRAQHLVLQV